MNRTGPTPRPGVMNIEPYVPGEAGTDVDTTTPPARLASNEGALGPSQAAVNAYRQCADQFFRYPDGGSTLLRKALAETHRLDEARVVCGAGSDELLGLIAQAYAGEGDEIIHTRHGFLMYPIIAHSVGATPISVQERDLCADVDAILAAVNEKTRLVYLANPNNPTGSYVTQSEVERLIKGLPQDVILVLDAAYAEYVTAEDYTAGQDLVEAHDNVIMTRTFSKLYAMAGLRLGWAYCPAAVADALNRVRGPFSVNLPAQMAGAAAVKDTDFLQLSQRHNQTWRQTLTDKLSAMGLTVYPSVANFILVAFPSGRAEAVRQGLKQRGVLVRQVEAYGLPDCLRISIGAEADMLKLLAALPECL